MAKPDWRFDVTKRICTVDGCDSIVLARGMCNKHYRRWRTQGTTEPRRVVARSCEIDDCDDAHYARGWCRRHYKRWQKTGDPLGDLRKPPATGCSVDGCDGGGRPVARGLCLMHYSRKQATGDTGPAEPLRFFGPDKERFWRLVDKAGSVNDWRPDLGPCWMWQGVPCGENRAYGQLRTGPDKRLTMAHRFSYELHVGPIPEGLQLDHLCRVTMCVRPDHLEPVTNLENKRRQMAALEAAEVQRGGEQGDAEASRATA